MIKKKFRLFFIKFIPYPKRRHSIETFCNFAQKVKSVSFFKILQVAFQLQETLTGSNVVGVHIHTHIHTYMYICSVYFPNGYI